MRESKILFTYQFFTKLIFIFKQCSMRKSKLAYQKSLSGMSTVCIYRPDYPIWTNIALIVKLNESLTSSDIASILSRFA